MEAGSRFLHDVAVGVDGGEGEAEVPHDVHVVSLDSRWGVEGNVAYDNHAFLGGVRFCEHCSRDLPLEEEPNTSVRVHGDVSDLVALARFVVVANARLDVRACGSGIDLDQQFAAEGIDSPAAYSDGGADGIEDAQGPIVQGNGAVVHLAGCHCLILFERKKNVPSRPCGGGR
jgi:hypothetical protein